MSPTDLPDPEPRRYIGVVWHGGRHQQWWAHVRHEGHLYGLGHYDTQEEAAKARDVGAIHLQGPDAQLNFDGEPPPGVSKWDIQQRILDIEAKMEKG